MFTYQTNDEHPVLKINKKITSKNLLLVYNTRGGLQKVTISNSLGLQLIWSSLVSWALLYLFLLKSVKKWVWVP